MRHLRHTDAVPADLRGAVVALGNFDGVHHGHQAVIAETRALAASLGAPSAVLTFEPHPRSLLRPDDPPFRLTPFRIKSRLIETLGIDVLFTVHFDRAFSLKPAEQFAEEVLVRGLGVRHVVVGHDFFFGHERGGDFALLERLGARDGYGVSAAAEVVDEAGRRYSSTLARTLLADGKPEAAGRILGRDWAIEGRVEHGDKRGRLIGFPTANIELADYLRPCFGVYAVRAAVDRGSEERLVWHDGVANLGRRPTVGGTVERLEVHLFDFDGDLYGQHLRVRLCHFIRPERRFDGIEALKAQIAVDAAQARAVLAAPAAVPLP